jgi:hypothetical protein
MVKQNVNTKSITKRINLMINTESITVNSCKSRRIFLQSFV